MKPFEPVPDGTVLIDISGSSQRIALARATDQVRVMNNGSATVWVNFGGSGVTASLTTSFPVGPGAIEVLSIASFGGQPYAAAIAAGTTGKVYFTAGTGW